MTAQLKSIKFSFDAENIPTSLRGDGPGFCTYLECEISDGRTASSHVFVTGTMTGPGMLYGMHESYSTMSTLLAKDGIKCPERLLPSDALAIAMYQHMEEVNA